MPELETLFVRIDADLSDFKAGLRQAEGDTRAFATKARRIMGGVGSALDLSPFRKELQKSETAVKESAERMRKAFAEVGKTQEKAMQRAIQNFTRLPGGPTNVFPQNPDATPGQSPGSSKEGSSTPFSLSDALKAAGFAGLLITAFAIPITGTAIAFIAGSGAAAGFLTPLLEKMVAGDGSQDNVSLDEQIEKLRRTIEDLEKKSLRGPRGGPPLSTRVKARDEELKNAQQELANALALKDAIAEQQRLAQEAAAQTQEFLTTFAELSDCLRQLCARIDGLAPLPSDAETPGGSRPGRVGFEGPRDGGRFLSASFTGAAGSDTLLGGAGLEAFRRQVIEAGGPLDGLTAKFADLTRAAGGFEARGGSLAELLGRTNTLFNDQVGAVRLLDAALPELGQALTSVFEAAAEGGRGLERVVEGLGQSLLDAFQGAAFEGKSFREVLKGIIDDILVISQLPGQGGGGGSLFGDFLGGIFGGIFGGGGSGVGGGAQFGGGLNLGVFAKGAAFEPGGVMARNIERFARGGIVDTPEAFAFARGLGIMGEDGPEAILPLTRTSDGELGVRASMPRLPELPPPAPAGPVFVINAPGADREGLREVMALIRRLQGQIVSVSRSITPIAINAVLDNRRRGGNIARAFGAR